MRDFANSSHGGKHQNLQGRASVALVMGVVFGWIGPFDTNELPRFTSLGFWTVMCLLWFVISSVVQIALARCVRGWQQLGTWQRLAFILPFSAPIGATIATLALEGLDRWKPSMFEALDLLTQTLVIGAVLEIIAAGILRNEAPARPRDDVPQPDIPIDPAAGDAAAEAKEIPQEQAMPIAVPARQGHVPPPLLERVAPAVRGSILCLEMEDHYVRVHTVNGSGLVLMRLRDAVTELAGIEGLRVHRSWWVARTAVEANSRKGRTAALQLVNGLIVPVSQPYLMDVLSIVPADATAHGPG